MGAALTMKEEPVFCSNMILELGFDKSFGSVPLFIDNRYRRQPYLYSSRKIYRAEVFFFVQELVKGKISIHYVVKSEDQLANLGTKHHSKHRHCDLIRLINEFKA